MALDAIDRTAVERADPLVGSVLDSRYQIHERIAAGGFAVIYRATHLSSKQEVAIKVLHTALVADRGVVARFRREGDALAQLHDKHTITAYELGEAPDGMLYMVMELLRGESLYERFRARGPLTWQAVIEIARGICSSLGEAHGLGIVHRDLKPANIHLEQRGDVHDFVKVLDFGIVRVSDNPDLDCSELTNVGQVIGTFDYMSPEQMVGGACTGSSDIYALGVLMYEMIAGIRPFADAGSLTSLLAAVLTSQPPRLASVASVPAALDRLVMRCLEREPQTRFADVHELASALERLVTIDEPVTRRISMSALAPEVADSDDVTRIEIRPSRPVVAQPPSPSRPIAAQPPPPSRRTRPPTPARAPHPTPPPPEPRRPSVPVLDAPHPSAMPQPVVDVDPALHRPIWQLAPRGPLPTPMPAFAPARGSSVDIQSYDMAHAQNRDIVMRRIVWALALALVGVLAFVIASHF